MGVITWFHKCLFDEFESDFAHSMAKCHFYAFNYVNGHVVYNDQSSLPHIYETVLRYTHLLHRQEGISKDAECLHTCSVCIMLQVIWMRQQLLTLTTWQAWGSKI